MEKSTTLILGRSAAILSAVEVGLGSILHSVRAPFSGHFLSLNQCFLMARSALRFKGDRVGRAAGFHVSTIAALLKSLSPAGKKLTPMLAISAQGMLFSIGTLLFGVNPFGVLLGCLLSSLWAFLQPLLVYYLIFGKTLLDVATHFYDKTREVFSFERKDLVTILLVLVGIKLLLAALAALLAFLLPESVQLRYEEKLLLAGRHKRKAMLERVAKPENAAVANIRLAVKDLLNPLFVFSLMLTVFFFIFSEAAYSKVLWALLRPLAVGFTLFFLIRVFSFERLFAFLERRGFEAFARSFRVAVETLKKI